jgi:hypothetical protein
VANFGRLGAAKAKALLAPRATHHDAGAMIVRQKRLQINEIPTGLQSLRSNVSRFVAMESPRCAAK